MLVCGIVPIFYILEYYPLHLVDDIVLPSFSITFIFDHIVRAEKPVRIETLDESMEILSFRVKCGLVKLCFHYGY